MSRTRKPLVGVTADVHRGSRIKPRSDDEKVLYLYDFYWRAVQDSGAAAVVLPDNLDRRAIRDTVARLDGLLLIGGNYDIPPRLYGEEPHPMLGPLKEQRSEFDVLLIREALRFDLPILGICGGMQSVNVALGGSLYQDISAQCPGSREHQQTKPKDRISHRVRIEPGSLLYRILVGRSGRQPLSMGVNSTHHQAIKALGQGLLASAYAADGIMEGLESPEHDFVVGVQWHPELLYRRRPEQTRLFNALTRAARRRGAARCRRRSNR